jgi:hypothetical protein
MLPSHVQSTLTVTPTIPLQPTTPYIPQNPIGTPVHHGMQNPATHIHSTMGQIPTGGKPPSSGHIPPRGKPSLHIPVPTGGKPPFIGQTPVVTQSMVGGQPSFTGNPSQSLGTTPRRYVSSTISGRAIIPQPTRRNTESQSFWITLWTTFPRGPESHLGSSRSTILSSPRAKSLPSSRTTCLPSSREDWLSTSD